MMAMVFARLLGAFVLNAIGRKRSGLACLMACLALSLGLFLWEIYSPEYGFGMPWLQF